jgi:hypothetical protein
MVIGQWLLDSHLVFRDFHLVWFASQFVILDLIEDLLAFLQSVVCKINENQTDLLFFVIDFVRLSARF